jgi:hypothetical protein
MKEIKLTQNQIAFVDDEDYDFLLQWKWCSYFSPITKTYYAIRNSRINEKIKRINIYMHREIMETNKILFCDHINHDTLNNQKYNLRNCIFINNMQNKKLYKNSTTLYKGVIFDKETGKYRSRIGIDNRKIHIGRFSSAIDAAMAYDKKAIELYGEFAHTNF